MSDCMLSVLITTYNIEGCVAEAIDSVLNQNISYKYEMLVGDDGSDDGTADVIKEYCRKSGGLVKLYQMERVIGDKTPVIVRSSRNRINLAKHASGKYLVFLDGDDVIINPDSLQNKIDILEDPNNNDCVMCGSNFNLYYDKSGRILPVHKEIRRKKLSAKVYWRSGMWIHAETNVIRNIIDFDHIENEYVNLDLLDDNLIVFPYLKHGNIYYLNSYDVNYRQNAEGYYNQGLVKQSFINMLVYSHANYFINALNQNLRCYNVIRELYHGKVIITRDLLDTVPYYGFSVANMVKSIEFWSRKSVKRSIMWGVISFIHMFYYCYTAWYLYGFKGVMKSLISKNGKR